jgi:hypothetical protein
MVVCMWTDKVLGQVTDKIGEVGDKITSEVEQAGELVTLSLVIIGTVACAALVLALIAEARTRG